ncbi:ABI gene family member 3 isoform X2 [Phyllobates terribilis]|uniref:ABI gene family member 3 isoform X2 n=1 Tax=Phyllobates terribilis TaxID=111132 RepID=UPI003CCB4161
MQYSCRMAYLMNKTPDVSSPRHEIKDIYREVFTARQALRDSYQNLQDVADYCEKNYMEAPDKRKALESTMSLVTQTLASVACQVGVAARHVSDMFEVQSLMLQKEEIRVRYVSQLLDIHMEKVARQKIGKMTTAKKFQHSPKIQSGQNSRPLGSYSRMPISFTSLDNTGHGIMDSDSQLSRTGTMSRRISVKTMSQTHGSLGKNSRVRDPITPPYIPAQKFQCPVSPDTIFPNFAYPTEINSDLPLPPPEHQDPSTLQAQRSLKTRSNFPDTCSLPCSDLPPPPPESDVNGSLWLPAPIIKGPSISDPYSLPYSDLPPPPPESDGNGSLWLPAPIIKDNQIPICESLQSVDVCFPPPPATDNAEKHSPWPIGNGLTSHICTEHSADDLPPPPDSEMTNTLWPGEDADTMESKTYLDDFPPPPDF